MRNKIRKGEMLNSPPFIPFFINPLYLALKGPEFHASSVLAHEVLFQLVLTMQVLCL
jgi:hypothetical protein